MAIEPDARPAPLLRYGMLEAGLLFGLGFWLAGAVIGGVTAWVIVQALTGRL